MDTVEDNNMENYNEIGDATHLLYCPLAQGSLLLWIRE